MATCGEQLLPVVRVAELPSEELAERWLVEQLWCARSVGVVGGAPKCAKTWLGLDMALSVATGTPCLGRYAVPEPGPVLIYLAEDALRAVREGAPHKSPPPVPEMTVSEREPPTRASANGVKPQRFRPRWKYRGPK